MKKHLVAAASALLLSLPTGIVAEDGSTFSHEELNFGRVLVDTCKPRKIVVTNTTGSAVQDPRLRVEGSTDFKIQTRFRKKCRNPMPAGERCTGYVDFCPSFFGNSSAILRFSGDDAGIPIYGLGNTHGKY